MNNTVLDTDMRGLRQMRRKRRRRIKGIRKWDEGTLGEELMERFVVCGISFPPRPREREREKGATWEIIQEERERRSISPAI